MMIYGIRGRDVLRYTLLPEILPRVRDLGGSFFCNVAYFVALVYVSVGLLPRGHPYLSGRNVGKYGLRHVIGAAASRLDYRWSHIDRIILFYTILAGVVMLGLQVIVLILSVVSMSAVAGGVIPNSSLGFTPIQFFVTQDPEHDIAFILLDRVLGIPDFGGGHFFDSCVARGTDCTDTRGQPLPAGMAGTYPWPFHNALRTMLQFYNMGILLVSVILIIYFTITIAGETAQSGTPFGRRFNHVWAPIRLTFFFFLIVPIFGPAGTGAGFNASQIIVLYAAKFGSGMGTNGWLHYNRNLITGTLLGPKESLIAMPEVPQVGSIVQFMHTAITCKYAMRALMDTYVQAYVVAQELRPVTGVGNTNVLMLEKFPTDDEPGSATPMNGDMAILLEALELSDFGDIVIRIGEFDPAKYPGEPGNVFPWCGEFVIQNPGVTEEDLTGGASRYPGRTLMFDGHFENLGALLWGDPPMHEWSSQFVLNAIRNQEFDIFTSTDIEGTIEWYHTRIRDLIIRDGIEAQRTADDSIYRIPDSVRDKGWAGAAIWYNTIADMNGAMVDAAMLLPRPRLWPDALEQVQEKRRKDTPNVSGPDRFNPRYSGYEGVAFRDSTREMDVAMLSYDVYRRWHDSEVSMRSVNADGTPSRTKAVTGNIIIDSINALFGTSGLFEMRDNADIHPLAQLSAIGKSMINNAIVAFGMAVGATVGLGLAGMMDPWFAQMAKPAAGMAVSIGTTGLLIGIMLFYVLPFLPFLYFFFAVGGWIRAIFEAIVGAPLWALAHLRIDGEGLPGRAAMNGYFLIFEIFVRPILIVFGLIGGILILTAQVRVLNEVFDLVVLNVAGREKDNTPDMMAFVRESVDEFFFTVMYAIIVYMMAMSSFKLIDLVPNQILRWIGSGVQTMGEQEKDPAGKLVNTVQYGTTATASQVGEASSMAQHAVIAKAIG